MNLFSSSRCKKIVKEEHKRTNNSYTLNKMVPSTAHRKIQEWVRRNVTTNIVFQSLQNELLATVETERKWNRFQRFNKFSVDGHSPNLQQLPCYMRTEEIFKFFGEEVHRKYRAHNQGLAVASARHQVAHVEWCGYSDERPPDSEGTGLGAIPAAGAHDLYTNEEVAPYAFVAHNPLQPRERSEHMATRQLQAVEGTHTCRIATLHLKGLHH